MRGINKAQTLFILLSLAGQLFVHACYRMKDTIILLMIRVRGHKEKEIVFYLAGWNSMRIESYSIPIRTYLNMLDLLLVPERFDRISPCRPNGMITYC